MFRLLALCGFCGAVFSALPKPTAPQLAFQEMELGALIHFNMATYNRSCSDGKSSPPRRRRHALQPLAADLLADPDPNTFNPVKLDTDQWTRSMVAFGAKFATLVAKHNCGFVLWPSNATLPNGTRYPFSVANTRWRGGKGDVVAEFLASTKKHGLGSGFYYSIAANEYLDKRNITDHRALVLQQLEELWGFYGSQVHGGLTELWFDGGIPNLRPQVKKLVSRLQPNAVMGGACGKVRRLSCPPAACMSIPEPNATCCLLTYPQSPSTRAPASLHTPRAGLATRRARRRRGRSGRPVSRPVKAIRTAGTTRRLKAIQRCRCGRCCCCCSCCCCSCCC